MINYKKLIKNILYSGIEEIEKDYNFAHRLAIFNTMALIATISLTILGINAFKDSLIFFGYLNIGLAVIMLLNYFFIRITKKFKLSFYCAVFFPGATFIFLFLTGGVDRSGSIWFNTFPLIAIFLLGARKGLISSIVVFIPIFFHLFYDFQFPGFIQYTFAFKIMFINAFIITVFFAYSFEIFKQKFFDKSEARTKQLEQTVTKLDKTSKDLEEALKQIVQSSKLASIGTLAAGVAHEINNPLTIIKGQLDMLEAAVDNEDISLDRIKKTIKSQNNSIQRIFKIVNGLSVYARFDSKEEEYFDIHKIIYESISLVENVFKAEDIGFIMELDAINPNVLGNTGKFQQVIMNLLTNSKDALDGRKKGKIQISSKNVGGNIEVIVTDNGSGISPENIDKVFDSFFTTKVASKGTGLGLGISYDIIKNMEGKITCNSILNEGTSFIMTFPSAEEIIAA